MKLLVSTAIGAVAAVAALLLVPLPDTPSQNGRAGVISAIETVTIAPSHFAYRMPGEFLKNGRPVDGPMVDRQMRRPVEIMTYQVSGAEYAACVADGACMAPEAPGAATPDMPVTGISYHDAMNYAWWLSQKTGESWRLPTDEEWAFAAAERFGDDALGMDDDDGVNPAARWLASYRSESAAAREPMPQPRGHFGINSNGLYDVAGNVWEWTGSCHARTRLDENGDVSQATPQCGVRILGGQHRSYMSSFIRDGKSGGCAAGIAPDNLGFRLVRDSVPNLGVALARKMFGEIYGS